MILATLCYLHHDQRTLMLHRVKKENDIHAGKWNGLGGKFEPGETPEDCVIREVREESGLEIRHPKLVGLLTFPQFKDGDWYVFVFTATEFDGRLIDSNEGHLQWIPDAQVESLPLWESDHIFLPWIRAGKFFSARFVYEGDALKEHQVTFY
ncbi:MAG: 8-oxo-dGTP diphosphatase [Anaerolineales bacterium]|nr:8-oxo-dGTP diphosphatase [Anaerolineales bacterium]